MREKRGVARCREVPLVLCSLPRASRKRASFSSRCTLRRERKDNSVLSVQRARIFRPAVSHSLSFFLARVWLSEWLRPRDMEAGLVYPDAFCGDILSYKIADIHRISIEMAADVAAASHWPRARSRDLFVVPRRPAPAGRSSGSIAQFYSNFPHLRRLHYYNAALSLAADSTIGTHRRNRECMVRFRYAAIVDGGGGGGSGCCNGYYRVRLVIRVSTLDGKLARLSS